MASSLSVILSSAAAALRVHQAATQVTAHNISNALTEGYSRQTVELTASPPVWTEHGWLGTGVQFSDIRRARDTLLDITFRRETTSASGHRLRERFLSQIEAALAEPGETGLGSVLDAFWSAWSDLANTPTSASAREIVRERGRQLADHLNRLSNVLDATRQLAVAHLEDVVARVNSIARELASLNGQIIAAEAAGHVAADLRDARDRLLDELASYAEIQVVERPNGGVGAAVGGVLLVDDAVAIELTTQSTGGSWSILTAGGKPVELQDGELGAVIELLNVDLPSLRNQLDNLARAIVKGVNDLHTTGVNPLGMTGIRFFDDQGGVLASVTAANIALSAEVEADAQAIAAGSGGPSGEYQAGANDIALRLSQLRNWTDATYLGNTTAGEYYAQIVASVGLAVATAADSATIHETLASNVDARRASVSGVSTDEELIRLSGHQAAYAAAAKVVAAVDEMLRTLLAIA